MSTSTLRARHTAEALVGIVVVIGLIVAIWFGYWWLALRVRSQQNIVNRNSYEYQTTYAQAVRSDILDVRTVDVQLTADPNNSALAAEKKALVTKTCGDAANVNDKGTFFAGDAATTTWLQANC